jgi:hypothetical protein
MNPLIFTRSGGIRVPPLWLYPLHANVVSYLTTFLLQAQILFWIQMAVLVVGVAWGVALASTVFFGAWYAQTHPTTGNDHVIRRLVRLLRFLTFGLTDAPSSDHKSEDASPQTGKAR